MAAVDEIAIKLGIQTGDLKAALSDANASIKEFGESGKHHAEGLTGAIHETSQSVRLLHHALTAGGLITVFKEVYELAIDYAEKYKGATDEDVESVDHLKESLETAKDNVGGFAASLIGFGDRYVTMLEAAAAALKSSFTGEGFAAGIANFLVIEKSSENIADLAKKRSETEKELAEITQKNVDLEGKIAWQEFDALDHATQRASLADRISTNLEEASKLEENSVEFQKKKNIILTDQERLQKLLTEDAKEDAAAALAAKEALAAAEKKAADDRAAALAAAIKQSQQLTEESLKAAAAYEAGYDSVTKTTKAIRDQIALLDEQAAKKGLGDLTGATYEFNGKTYGPSMTQDQIDQLSPTVLAELIKRNQAAISEINASKYSADENPGSVVSGFLFQSEAIAQRQTEIQRAQFVLKQNSSLAGADYNTALKNFGGPLSQFDAQYQAANSATNTLQQNQLSATTAIAQTLNKIFPTAATPVSATR